MPILTGLPLTLRYWQMMGRQNGPQSIKITIMEFAFYDNSIVNADLKTLSLLWKISIVNDKSRSIFFSLQFICEDTRLRLFAVIQLRLSSLILTQTSMGILYMYTDASNGIASDLYIENH